MANKRITDKGRQYLLDIATGNISGPIDVDYRLYQSNITPTENDTDATYAGSDATFTGYAPVNVVGWTPSAAVGVARQSLADAVIFTVGPAPAITNNIYGYYAVIHGTDEVVWALRFDAPPLAMATAGFSIGITPKLTVKSEFA